MEPMIETSPSALETTRIPVGDGTEMIVHVAKPDPQRAHGGAIIIFQEAYGVNDYLRSVTARFAGLGLIAVAPELYHRSGDGVVGSYDAGHDEIAPYTKATTAEGLANDIRATYDWLAAGGLGTVDPARIAALGFCMGGRVAYLANGTVPLAAAVSFYGGRIARWFDLLPRQSGPLLMFWGAKDDTVDEAQRRDVSEAFDNAGLVHTEVVFSEAQHGFFRHVRDDVYEPRAAGQAWALSIEFLRQNGVLPAD
jgi:carboxymethylenebutenolidase